ncbi:MAG: PEPxxWA-CTERM sorting domain-containing protein [Proteobacteria bacterium]|nr:PEPxxWA-CTERM sorting domain-containing protein [Pseudomonadota bacterium]
MNSATKLITAFAFVCTAFSNNVNAATIDFTRPVNEPSYGNVAFSDQDGRQVKVDWGSWITVWCFGDSPGMSYDESYSFSILAPDDSWLSFRIFSSGPSSGEITHMSFSSLFFVFDPIMTIEPPDAGGEIGSYEFKLLDGKLNIFYASYAIIFDLEKSWVDFGDGHIYLSQFVSQSGPFSGVYGSMDVNSYFREAHIVYDVMAVPEPETWAMLLAGLGLMAGVTRRRRKNR